MKNNNTIYLRYLYAVLAVPVIVLTRFAILPLTGQGTPYITLFPVTVIVAMLGGMGPAVLTGVLGVLCVDYFFIQPLFVWDLGIEFWSRTAVVVLTSFFVGYVGSVLRAARVKAENQAVELAKSREDLNRAQTVALTGSWRLDTHNNKLILSDEAYNIFGVTTNTPLTYDSFLSYIHPDDHKYVDKKWQAAIKGEKYDIEHRILVNGQVKWVHERAELEYEKDGTLSGGFGTVTDITEQKKREEELQRLNRTLRALSYSTQAISHAKDEKNYLQEVCDIIINDCGHAMVWIGFTQNDAAKSVRPIAYSGFEKGYLETLNITWADTELGRGPTGTAIRTGRNCFCRNMLTDPAFEPWRKEALKRGYASSIVLPLLENDKTFGALSIYSREPDPFTADEIKLLTELANDVSLGITQIRLRRARDQAEETLHESEQRYRSFVEASSQVVWTTNSAGEVILDIPSWQAFTGQSADEAKGMGWMDAIRPEDRNRVAEAWRKASESKGIYEVEYLLKTHDGSWRDILARGVPLLEVDGSVREYVGTCIDITERKKAETELLKEKKLSDSIIDSLPGVFYLFDEQGQFLRWNKNFEDVMGYTSQEMAQINPVDMFEGEDKKLIADRIHDVFITGNSFAEAKLASKRSIRPHYYFTGKRVIYQNKPCLVGMGIDITERIKAEKSLQLLNEQLEQRVVERTAELEKAGEKIQAERQQFYDVLETLPAYVCLLTPDYYMPFANRIFREWFGYQPDKKCYEFLFDRKEPCENCDTYNVLKTGKPQRWEWTGPNDHNYDIYDFPFKDTDGTQLILEMGIDITDRKKAQEELRAVSLYSRSLLEASLDPLVTISSDGKITDVNEATIQVTGVSREELIGTDFSNYFTEPVKARDGYQQVFAQGFVTDYPLTIRHRNGRLTDVLYNATVYKNEEGKVQGIFAAARDVTEKKQTEKRQAAINSLLELYVRKSSSKDYLDAAVKVIKDWSGCSRVGIRVKDEKGNIPYQSFAGFEKEFIALENSLNLEHDKCLCIRAALQNPNLSDNTILTAGGSFYTNDSLAFLKGLSSEQVKEYRGQCMQRGFQSIGIIPIRYREEVLGVVHIADTKKDMVPLNNVQFIESTITPLIGEAIHRFDTEAELDQYRMHLEDIAKQRTEELARSNKDLEQFAYVASHDLQEPLRAVSGFVSLLERQLRDSLNEKTKEYMNFTVDGVARMQALINGLLEYSRIDTRAKPPVKTEVKKSLEDAMLSLQTSIEESGARITFDKMPVISIDPIQLSQLFQNLLGNAIKFRSEKQPEIHISAERMDGAWRFAVNDNGIGIDPQYKDRIFLIFQRLHTRTKYPGTGIGLALCKKIVEKHGGEIWVESEQGQGSTFYFTIPELEGEN